MGVVMFAVPVELYKDITTITSGMVLPLGNTTFSVKGHRSKNGTVFHAHAQTHNGKDIVKMSSLIRAVGATPHLT